MRCRLFPFIAYLLVYRQFDSSTNRDVELSIVCFDDSLSWQQIVLTINCYDNKLLWQQIVQTISCTKKGLSYNKIVKTIVSSSYCFYNSLLRPKSLSMPYSCRAYLSTAALPCKVGRDEYDRTDIENCSTALKKKNPAVEILLSIRRTRPCQGR